MSSGLGLKTVDSPSGWVLVESRLGRRGRYYCSSLSVHRRSSPDAPEEIPLPILPDGRIHELIRLPRDVAGLAWQPPENGHGEFRLKIRPVGWFERTWRMANRVLRTYALLSDEERLKSGLTLSGAVLDLPGAYRIASGFRVHLRPPPYAEWVERFDALHDRDCRRIRAHVESFASLPHFNLLLVTDEGGREAVQATLASLRAQLYRNFRCIVVDRAGVLDPFFHAGVELKDTGMGSRIVAQHDVPEWLPAFNTSLARGRAGEWVMLLRAGDTLPRHALYWFACESRARPDVAIVYSDDDTVDAAGQRLDPRFKPDWSLEHLRSTHYVGAAVVLSAAAVAAAGGLNLDCCRHGNYDLVLRVIDSAGERIAHVPAVLFHRGSGARSGSAWEDPQWCAGALRAHLARNAVAAEVAQTLPECLRIRYRLPETPPLVSIIVPTRDAPVLLRRCLDSLLEKTTYPRFEILVVDNRSADPQSLDYLSRIARHPAVRVLRYDRPFNYSALNNFAVRQARGDILCLLNNDTEVISPDWLEEMVGHLLQARVGVVGAKLYYPDGRVQHAGDAVGPGGCANHLHSFIGRNDPGYCNRAAVAQELSAVTAACLITRRDLYLRLGGLDEKHLQVAFNDVDYCLRVREAGYQVVWTPHAELYHHESVSRGEDASWRGKIRAEREVAVMRRRWRHVMRHDPFYNPNLSYREPDFSLSRAPRVKRPWMPA
ncbi:MAG: glycosyltransferase family 2 protein [Burkholderiales bacterium]